MIRNIVFILLLFASTVVLSALQKPVFLLWYAPLVADASWSELANVVLHGLSLDATMAGYVCLLPAFIMLLALWMPHKVWQKISYGWSLTAAAIIAVGFSCNLGLYKYWGFPLDGSVLQFLVTPKEAAASVSLVEFVVTSVVAAAYFVLSMAVYKRIRPLYNSEIRFSWGLRVAYSLVVLLIVGLDFMVVRGGVTTAVANVSKVYFSDKTVLNHAAVNPVFSFLSSTSDGENLDQYDFFAEEFRAQQAEAIFPDKSAPSTEQLLTTTRPNIVLILAESFGRSTMDEVVDGRSVAPNLQRLREESVWFENLIASSFRTDRGVLATLSGFCSQPTMSIMKEPQRASRLPSIAGSLRAEGYSTTYVHGGDLNFTNMASYLYGTGFERLVAYKDLSFDAPTSKWGYADDVLADYFVDVVKELERGDKPYFAVWQTLSSHEPFDVPVDEFEDKMLNSMYFADCCIARVVESLRQTPEWNNTLVVIIADHAYKYPYGASASAVIRHRIPMMWLGGAVAEPMVVEEYCSQSDFAATLLAQMGIDHSAYTLSRDVFSADRRKKFGYYTFNNGFGVVDSTQNVVFDCTSSRVLSDSLASEELVTIGKTLLQTTYKNIREL